MSESIPTVKVLETDCGTADTARQLKALVKEGDEDSHYVILTRTMCNGMNVWINASRDTSKVLEYEDRAPCPTEGCNEYCRTNNFRGARTKDEAIGKIWQIITNGPEGRPIAVGVDYSPREDETDNRQTYQPSHGNDENFSDWWE